MLGQRRPMIPKHARAAERNGLKVGREHYGEPCHRAGLKPGPLAPSTASVLHAGFRQRHAAAPGRRLKHCLGVSLGALTVPCTIV